MDKQFTASEVREYANYDDSPEKEMLYAFADMLEAQEKAAPVAIVKDSDALYTGYLSWTGEPPPPETRLYTHPSPADAERLAEALQEILDYRGGAANALEDEYVVDRAHHALAAHSAQAQPHTVHPEHSCEECGGQNVTWFAPSELWNDVVRGPNGRDLMLCPMCFIKRAEKVGHSKDAWSVRPEFYEESAQPPAASVTDGFVFERVNMGRGNERYVGLADGSEGTTVQEDGDGPGDTRSRLLWRIADAVLAAQENPNG